jgi:FAD/FMN-containing dehydrogenase/SAM-dependent methyltransferase
MGGQTASPESLHLDMRGLNQVIELSVDKKWIRVQAGIRWCDIQRLIDAHDLSVKIMQTYANFTVGGSLGVNCHGRYIGLGPLVLSVRALRLVMADGSILDASPTENADIFYGAIGGYGGLGIVVEVELDLTDNVAVEQTSRTMPLSDYLAYFKAEVRDSGDAVFHNADLYPPHYSRVRAVTWSSTSKSPKGAKRLMTPRKSYSVERYFMWAFSESPFGKWRREHIIEPLFYLRGRVHWRNYEAGYDVAELEPRSRQKSTYVLQEYFVPIDRLEDFVGRMGEILQRHKANAINVSIRHALADPGTYLAWAHEEVFAFVLYYKQGTSDAKRGQVAVWTRELIDAVTAVGGTYYLPYQPHATVSQFHRAYPRARDLFALKQKHDPEFRLRNTLWNKYYAEQPNEGSPEADSEFLGVYGDVGWRDAFFHFLQTVFNVLPEDRFHQAIQNACADHDNDADIYRDLQTRLKTIKPPLGDLTYGLPALKTQKREMASQMLQVLKGRESIDGCVEIGSTGRYVSELSKSLRVTGPIILMNDIAPSYAPPDMMERGQISKLGRFLPLNDYAPLAEEIGTESVDLVSCLIGLHHAAPENLDGFVTSIRRVLRPGGLFILRDHDVPTPEMKRFVSLVHTVFNAGIGVSWEENAKEPRYFAPLSRWTELLRKAGFEDLGIRLLQANDPSDNTLMAFRKV